MWFWISELAGLGELFGFAEVGGMEVARRGVGRPVDRGFPKSPRVPFRTLLFGQTQEVLSCPNRIDLLTFWFSSFGPFLVMASQG